jgi:hypothetical protein
MEGISSTIMNRSEISVRGAVVSVPAAQISGRTIIVTGKWLSVAALKDEDYQQGDLVPDPEHAINCVRRHEELNADVFTFAQKITDPEPRFPFQVEWESVAVVPLISYEDWWTNCVSTDLRKDVRRSAKRGVVVRPVQFDDCFVRGIKHIYDEMPVRHGRPFWHYGKDVDTVMRENATYLDRSEFLGAFLGDELIGFLKVVYVDKVGRLMQIISKDAHRDKRPTNALIAKAIEVVAAKGCSHLTYGKYRYIEATDSLTAFKARNGFQEVKVPRYFVPITRKGKLALRFHLHHGVKGFLPPSVLLVARRARATVCYRFPVAGKAT